MRLSPLVAASAVALSLAACGARSTLGVEGTPTTGTTTGTGTGGAPTGCDDSPSPECVDCDGNFFLAHCVDGAWVCPQLTCACEVARWQRTAGGSGLQDGTALAVAGDGSILVGGVFGGTINLGGGTFSSSEPDIYQVDAVLAYLLPDGSHAWSRAFGAQGDDSIEDLDLDPSGHPLVLGAYRDAQTIDGFALPQGSPRSLFLSKHLPTGEAVWAQAFVGGANGTYGRLQALPDGGMVIAGDTSGTLTWSGGSLTGGNAPEAFVIRLDADGNTLWAHRFPAELTSSAIDVAAAPDGSILLVGGFRGSIDFGQGLLTSAGGFDAFLVALDPAGNVTGASSFGGPGRDVAHRVVIDALGHVIVMAAYQDGADLGGGPLPAADLGGVVASYDGAFHLLWQAPFTGVTDEVSGDDVWQLAVNSQGQVILAGQFQGTMSLGGKAVTSEGDYDVAVATLDATGQAISLCSYGSPLYDHVGAMATRRPGDEVLLTGGYYGSIDFGLGPLSNDSEGDMFIAELPAATGP